MMERTARGLAVLLAFGLFVGVSLAQPLASSELTQALQRILNRHEFDAKQFGPARWIDNGAAYATLETSVEFPQANAKEAAPSEIVRCETSTGRRTVLVRASQLVPSPGARPFTLENYSWSQDSKWLLVYRNSKKVWRQNTRGDYWVLNLANGKLQKLGGDAPESSLMFAKFSPAGGSVAWVRANNLYVEDVSTGAIRRLTTDGSATRINETSDWVNEEEFDIRDGFRWNVVPSPQPAHALSRGARPSGRTSAMKRRKQA